MGHNREEGLDRAFMIWILFKEVQNQVLFCVSTQPYALSLFTKVGKFSTLVHGSIGAWIYWCMFQIPHCMHA